MGNIRDGWRCPKCGGGCPLVRWIRGTVDIEEYLVLECMCGYMDRCPPLDAGVYEVTSTKPDRTRPTWVPEKPRFLNWIYAHLFAYFWLPCGRCGKYYGGHEWDGNGDGGSGTCWRHKDTVAGVEE